MIQRSRKYQHSGFHKSQTWQFHFAFHYISSSFLELANHLLRSQVSIEIEMDYCLKNSKTILTLITEFVETANSCRTELKSNFSTQLNLCMRPCIRFLNFFNLYFKKQYLQNKPIKKSYTSPCTKLQLSSQIRLERRWTDTRIEPLHNLLSGISCSFVDTIGLSRVNLCIKKGGGIP